MVSIRLTSSCILYFVICILYFSRLPVYVGAVGSSDGLSKTHFFLQHCSIVSALQSPLPSGGHVDFSNHFLLISTIFLHIFYFDCLIHKSKFLYLASSLNKMGFLGQLQFPLQEMYL